MVAASRSRVGLASALVVALVVGLMGWLALRSQGAVVHETDLSDGGVWVTNDSQARFGRVNKAVGQLDAGVGADGSVGSGLDVLQDGAAVLGVSRATGSLYPIDVRLARLGSATASVPGGSSTNTGFEVFEASKVELRGGTVAIVEPASGRVWAQRVDTRAGVADLGGLAMTGKPLATVGAQAAVTVDVGGNVHAVSAVKGAVVTIPVKGAGFGKPVTSTIDLSAKVVDISAVGDRWVVYDPEKDTVWYAGAGEPVKGGFSTTDGQVGYAALQQPGPAAPDVAIEGRDAVRLVHLGQGSSANGGVTIPSEGGVTGNATGARITRPVVLGRCVYGAWAMTGKVLFNANCGSKDAVPTATITNVGKAALRDGVKFRTNRGVLVLNDLDSGAVWDLDSKPIKIDNWDTLTPPSSKDDKKNKDKNLVDDTTRTDPPKAENDQMRARAGRTSVLHVLDNDSDPSGGILAIPPTAVTDPKVKGVAVAVSGDGQAIDLTLADQVDKTSFAFTYEVSNGKAKAKATVTVEIVPLTVNSAPVLRPGGAKLASTVYPVLPGKQVALQVIGDWRDPENDTLSLETRTAVASVDGAGRLNVTAPARKGSLGVPFAVVDELGAASTSSATVDVLDPVDGKPVAARTQPDAVRGVVGKPVQVQPLDNDIPGADPTDPDARLRLAASLAGQGPLKVDTNLDTGTVTLTSQAAGTFELTYGAQVGTTVSPGRIRVDVAPAAKDDTPPVAVPDSALLRDQAPALVDVLANDFSPRADVLVTQAVAADPSSEWLRASIFQGRWVRVEATEPAGLDKTDIRRGTLTYTVSDGTRSATGQVQVVQRGPLTNILPVVVDDVATVRVGDVVTVPILDNDTMAGGIPLRVDPASVKVIAGASKQNAFLSGNVLRYVPEDAPATLAVTKDVTLEYAAYPEGLPELAQTGRVTVTVQPLPTATLPNRAPAARSFSTSVTAGEALTITVPTSGVDPDGDSVTVTGVVGADTQEAELSLGRIVGFGPSTIRFEAYPLAAGTEVVHYEVADRFGGRSRGFIRVGVVPPSEPQPPVAVQDDVVAAPGKTVTVPFTENDLIGRGDPVTVEYRDLNDTQRLAAWKVDEDAMTVATKAPEPGAQVQQFTYGLDDGLFDPSRAAVLVRGQKGFNNLPTALDDVAKPKPGETSTLVDVLANDRDIDSAPDTLTVARVLSPDATVEGGQVRVKILDHAYSVPYVAADEDGGEAMALIYVPTGSKGDPFVVDSALIEMAENSTKDVALNDYVKSPRSRDVSVTAVDTVSASPQGRLDVEVTSKDTVRLTSSGDYVGPGAVMLEVTDKPTKEDQSADAEAKGDYGKAYVSVPVQVGPKTAILRCPDFSVTLNAGGRARELDIPSLCHAWVPIGMSLDDVRFSASWEQQPGGTSLKASGQGNRTVTLEADAGAPGGDGLLRVQVAGSDQVQNIKVSVLAAPSKTANAASGAKKEAPPPTLRPVAVQGLKEGSSQSVDLSAYLNSPLADAACRITTARVEAGTSLTASASGCTLTLSAGAAPSPTGSVALVVTDKPGSGREAAGRATVTMLGAPGTPVAVSAVADRVAGGQARVSWTPAGYNGGSPVTGYTVAWTGGSRGSTVCTSSPCTITGLKNGTDYTFTVAATNAIGTSGPSAPSGKVRPDTKPGQPQPPTMTKRGDTSLTFAWAAPPNKGSAIKSYRVSVIDAQGRSKGVQTVGATTLSYTATGLDNNQVQKVKVQAVNELGPGPWSAETQMQSAGKPAPVTSVVVQPSQPTPSADSSTVTVSWSATNPNGPAIKQYDVQRRVAGGAWASIQRVSAQTFRISDNVRYDGRTYQYMVRATNGADLTSDPGNTPSFTNNGIPTAPARVTASTPSANKGATLVVVLGSSRSSGFNRVQWRSSAGGSGSVSGSWGDGATVSIRPTGLDTVNQTFTVTATNNGGRVSGGRTSNSVRPYGPTRTPTAGSSTHNGRTVSFTWRLPENGRPITAVEITGDGPNYSGAPRTSTSFTGGGWSTRYCINIRARSVAGWSSALRMCETTGPEPKNPSVRVSKGPNRVAGSGSGSCTSSPGCPTVAISTTDLPAGSYSVRTKASDYGSPSGMDCGSLTVGAGGGVTSRSGYCVYGKSVGTVTATLTGGGRSFSGSVFWD